MVLQWETMQNRKHPDTHIRFFFFVNHTHPIKSLVKGAWRWTERWSPAEASYRWAFIFCCPHLLLPEDTTSLFTGGHLQLHSYCCPTLPHLIRYWCSVLLSCDMTCVCVTASLTLLFMLWILSFDSLLMKLISPSRFYFFIYVGSNGDGESDIIFQSACNRDDVWQRKACSYL